MGISRAFQKKQPGIGPAVDRSIGVRWQSGGRFVCVIRCCFSGFASGVTGICGFCHIVFGRRSLCCLDLLNSGNSLGNGIWLIVNILDAAGHGNTSLQLRFGLVK
jgi:hypothetical protein